MTNAKNGSVNGLKQPLSGHRTVGFSRSFNLVSSRLFSGPCQPAILPPSEVVTHRTKQVETERNTVGLYPKPVLSAGNSWVVRVANPFYGSNAVYIDHGNGLTTECFHLTSFLVKPNQTVTKGEEIGIAGETGRVTGPHLHFGARWHGACINPGYLFIDPADMPAVQ